MAQKVINKVTNESWLCDNINDEVVIEGQKFIWVYRNDRPESKLMMNKEAVTVMLISENDYSNRPQLNG